MDRAWDSRLGQAWACDGVRLSITVRVIVRVTVRVTVSITVRVIVRVTVSITVRVIVRVTVRVAGLKEAAYMKVTLRIATQAGA